MTWADRINAVQIGDTVRFTRQWLRENDRTGTDLAKTKGTVTAIQDEDGYRLATVEWDKPDIPDLVNVLNLSKEKQRQVE